MATSVEAKMLKSTKFPPEFNQKVDMQKVNLEVMKRWIAGKISSILGSEDDVVVELCFNLIEGARYPDIKKLQIQLTGFLEKDTAAFCKDLWKLCLSAQSNPQGVPKELLEAKKLELIQEKIDAEKAADESRRRREIEQRREREIDSIRNREMAERGRGGGRGDSWRGGRSDRSNLDRGGRDFERRVPRRSRSPAPRRRDSRDRGSFRGPPLPRDIDTYIPSGRGNRRRDEPRRRSPSASLSPRYSAPRSRSPPRRRRRSDTESISPRPRRRTPSPDRHRGGYRGRGGRARERSPDRSNRRRSYTPSEDSRSWSPTTRKRRRSLSKSTSPSPPPRSRHRSRRNTSSISRSRSSSRHSSRDRTVSRRERNRASPDPIGRDIIRTGVNARKGRDHDERRLTRSNSRDLSLTPRRRRRSLSRSRSRSGERERKRRRSLQRYAPASRRRNTSSVSSPTETRDKRADSSEYEGVRRSHSPDVDSKSPIRDRDMARTNDPQEIMPPEKQANELREKLLREKIMKMRTMSTSSSNPHANDI